MTNKPYALEAARRAMRQLSSAEHDRVLEQYLSDGIAADADLIERLKQEAQIHAQEARTANATIAEIYRAVTGGTGEPGCWNGAEPVRARLAADKARIAELEKDAARYRWLRDKSQSFHSFYLSVPAWMANVSINQDRVDQSIDAAIALALIDAALNKEPGQ